MSLDGDGSAAPQSVHEATDVFLEMTGEIAGIQLSDDSRGWYSSADVAVIRGTLADVEAITGPTRPLPQNPDDFSSGPLRAPVPNWRAVSGRRKPPPASVMVRVIVELDGQGSRRARRVTVFFDRARE